MVPQGTALYSPPGDYSLVSSRVQGGRVYGMGLHMLMVSRHLPYGAGDTGLGGKERAGQVQRFGDNFKLNISGSIFF